jgi:hypothetical protein
MPDYLFLMHNDAVDPVDQALWHPYRLCCKTLPQSFG